MRDQLREQMALNAARTEEVHRLTGVISDLRRQLREVRQELREEQAIRADLEAENTKFRRVLRGHLYV